MSGEVFGGLALLGGAFIGLALQIRGGPAQPGHRWVAAAAIAVGGMVWVLSLPLWAATPSFSTVLHTGVLIGVLAIVLRPRILRGITEHLLIAYLPPVWWVATRLGGPTTVPSISLWALAALLTILVFTLVGKRSVPSRRLRVAGAGGFIVMVVMLLAVQFPTGQLEQVLSTPSRPRDLAELAMTGAVLATLTSHAAMLVWPALVVRYAPSLATKTMLLDRHEEALADAFETHPSPWHTSLAILGIGGSALALTAWVPGWDPMWAVNTIILLGPMIHLVASGSPRADVAVHPAGWGDRGT